MHKIDIQSTQHLFLWHFHLEMFWSGFKVCTSPLLHCIAGNHLAINKWLSMWLCFLAFDTFEAWAGALESGKASALMHPFAPRRLFHLAEEVSVPHREQLTTQGLSFKVHMMRICC